VCLGMLRMISIPISSLLVIVDNLDACRCVAHSGEHLLGQEKMRRN